nr:hypothetical protein [Tanacetum cinerariifolium]
MIFFKFHLRKTLNKIVFHKVIDCGEVQMRKTLMPHQDCEEEAFARRQVEEFDATSLRAIVYKFDKRSPVSKSTPSSFRTKGVEATVTKIETPPLDQTEGRKERSQARKLSHPKIQEEPSHTVDDSGVEQDQEFNTGNNDEQPVDKEVSKEDWFKKPKRPPTLDSD